ncbi:hypothetical protein B0J12DRAFT_641064 [Macrophomina phaseolina]|uniref:ABM domain-containing protein n=1 Tax=Macrophomina phaseolina TaxID=35725 RepID=A0ABQ8GX66_9PEZI|nr:hypothetical protein B0J12DRAFT_641064 [Macrophomina phaseolina]
MSDRVAVLRLRFRPGANARDAESPAGASLQQALASIAKDPRGACELYTGFSLGDPDRFTALICISHASFETSKTTMALDAHLAPLDLHIIPPAATSVYAFSRRLRRRDFRSGFRGLTILRFPTAIADMDEEADDPESRFQEGLALIEQFGSTAAWRIGCDGPGDLVAQLDARAVNEGPGTELLLLHVWRSEQAMRRFQDQARGNAYDATPPTGFEQTPDDLWDRCWARGLALLRKEGVEIEELHVKHVRQS